MAALKALYKERALLKEQALKEKEKRKEQLEEAAFLYRLSHFELYPSTPSRRRGGSLFLSLFLSLSLSLSLCLGGGTFSAC